MYLQKNTQNKLAMKKTLLAFLLLVLISTTGFSQQDPMFTKYMFNSLIFNPAYAGSKDHMAISLLHRDQWWGIEGAPKTQTFTIHSPLKDDRVALGLGVYNDKIGPTNTLSVMTSYAYRIQLGKGKLSFGLQAGVMNWKADFTNLNLDNQADPSFMEPTPNLWKPNFGAGIFYYTELFYAGLSVPHILDFELYENPQGASTEFMSKQFRHYFLTAGLAIPFDASRTTIFKPSILIKNVGLFGEFKNEENTYANIGAPTEMDIDVSFLFYEALWIGASFRTALEAFTNTSSFDSVDFWAAYYLRNGFRVGASFDFTLNELQSPAQGSFEVMLGYEFNYKEKLVVTPRYF